MSMCDFSTVPSKKQSKKQSTVISSFNETYSL
jgi:hypothetical protein